MGSTTIKGITVALGGDTTKLQKSFKDLDGKSRSLQKELTLVNKELKFDPKNSTLLAAKQEVLSEKVETTRQKLKLLNDMQAEVEKQAKAGTLGADKYRQYQTEVESTKNILANLEKQLKTTGDEFAEVQRKSGAVTFKNAEDKVEHFKGKVKDMTDSSLKHMDELSKGFDKAGDNLERIGSVLNKGSAAAGAALVSSTKFAMDFEDAMAKVSTIADENEVSMDRLRQQILDLSNDTGIAATDIAENVYNAISAGQKTGDAVSFVGKSLALSKAGFADTGAALDVLTTIMNAYGMSAKEVGEISDMLIQTQNLGKVTVGELASSMGKVIPTANSYGVQLDQLAAAYSITTAKGIAAAESTTYINSMLNELGKSGTKSSDALKELTGKSFKEMMDEGASLSDVLAVLQEEADKNNKSLGDMFGSAEAAKAATTLLGDSAKVFNDRLLEMNDSTGATDTAMGKLKTTSSQTKKIVNELKNAGIELGDEVIKQAAPLLKDVMGGVKDVTTWLKKLTPEQKKVLTRTIEIIAVAGPVVTIIGKINKGIGNAVGLIPKAVKTIQSMTSATKSAETAQIGLNAAQSASPVGALITLLGLLAAAITTYYMTTDEATMRAAFLTEEEDKLYRRIDENIEKWNELKATREEASKEIEGQYGYYEGLSDRLKEITDKSGEIKSGYEEEARTIVNVLNDAFGKEYEITGNVIQNYQQMQEEIDKLIQLQKAQAQQEAYSESYKEAISNRTQAWQDVQDAEKSITEKDNKLRELREKYNRITTGKWVQTSTGRQWVRDTQKEQEKAGVLADIKYEEGQRENAVEKFKEYQQTYLESLNLIQNYEGVVSAIASKDSDAISEALTRMTSDFVTADNATQEMLENQHEKIGDALAAVSKAYDEKAPGVTKSMLDNYRYLFSASQQEMQRFREKTQEAAESTTKAIEDETPNTKKAGEMLAEAPTIPMKELPLKSGNLGKDFVQGFINSLKDGTMLTNLWNAAKGIGSTALNAVKSFLGIASPSKEAAKLGRFTAEGFALGLEKETRNAVKSASNLAAEAQNELSNINLQNAFSSLSALKNSRLSDVVTRTINNSTTTTNKPVINVNVSGVTINNDSDIDALTDRIANQLGEKMIQDGRRWG